MKPVNALLEYPSIQPVVQTVSPHYHEAVRRATPVVKAVQARADPHVRALSARTQTLAAPYVKRVELEYYARVYPYVLKVQPHYRVAARYTQAGWKTVQTRLGPHVSRAQIVAVKQWHSTIVPKVLVPVWEQLQLLPALLEARFGDQARALKSTYVDAQLTKMSVKIKELSGRATHNTAVISSTSSTSTALSAKAYSVLSSVAARASSATQSVKAAVVSSSLTIVDDLPSTTSLTPSPTEVPSAESEPTLLSDIIIETVESTITSSTPSSSSVVEPASTTDAPEVIAPSPVANAPPAEAEEDPLAFLEAYTSTAAATSSTEAERPHYTPPSADELEARKKETALKRANLEGRNANWEAKIDDTGKANRVKLIEQINRIRLDAVSSLSLTETDPASIGAQVAAFKAEGAKALKGTRAYVDKLMSGHYHGAEKVGLFDNVVQKVDTRYIEGAAALSDKVAHWWASVREEVDQAAQDAWKELDGIAGEAQSDLGMDYSYLDDVTTQDWAVSHLHLTTISSILMVEVHP